MPPAPNPHSRHAARAQDQFADNAKPSDPTPMTTIEVMSSRLFRVRGCTRPATSTPVTAPT